MRDWDWAIGLLAGFAVAWALRAMVARARAASAAQELARLEERASGRERDAAAALGELAALREENTGLHRELAAADERVRGLEVALREGKNDLEALNARLTAEFEALATRVLEANSERFATRNRESLDRLLAPLGERIASFRERVESAHDQGLKDRAALVEQLKSLGELNQRLSAEASNLARALKGQVKTQGNWGELILSTVLEKSGLVAGQEYEAQASVAGDDGRRRQPDVVVKLPEGRRLVVDAKVSLVAYERCVNAESEGEREAAAREHVQSLRGHVAELGRKRYDTLFGGMSPDFVLLFVPVEPAFALAMQRDDTLFDAAFRQNVVMVTPTTLLATLRTVAGIWRQEKQTRNALEIAERGGALYDKFVGFCEDLERVGETLRRGQEAYDSAMGKLRTGRGNLVGQAQALRDLGAKAKKALPEDAGAG